VRMQKVQLTRYITAQFLLQQQVFHEFLVRVTISLVIFRKLVVISFHALYSLPLRMELKCSSVKSWRMRGPIEIHSFLVFYSTDYIILFLNVSSINSLLLTGSEIVAYLGTIFQRMLSLQLWHIFNMYGKLYKLFPNLN
jgi:hypothetical protein